jgi:hypothetical protein
VFGRRSEWMNEIDTFILLHLYSFSTFQMQSISFLSPMINWFFATLQFIIANESWNWARHYSANKWCFSLDSSMHNNEISDKEIFLASLLIRGSVCDGNRNEKTWKWKRPFNCHLIFHHSFWISRENFLKLVDFSLLVFVSKKVEFVFFDFDIIVA